MVNYNILHHITTPIQVENNCSPVSLSPDNNDAKQKRPLTAKRSASLRRSCSRISLRSPSSARSFSHGRPVSVTSSLRSGPIVASPTPPVDSVLKQKIKESFGLLRNSYENY